ncbi:MAG: polysaccharide deacetylase family protein [Bacteroidota bacterium]
MSTLLIYTTLRSKRLQYIADYLFETLLGLKIEWTDNVAYFRRSDAAKLNYSQSSFDFPCLHIVPHTLLKETNISVQIIDFQYIEGNPFFFKTNEVSAIQHDLLAAAFYLLSRYEEYLPFEADEHGRFSAHQSLAYKTGFLQRPLIQEWATHLGNQLKSLFPHIEIRSPKYTFQATFDIDIAWAYRHRPLWRSVGASLRDFKNINFSTTKDRWATLLNAKRDSYFIFDELEQWHEKPPIYFFLLADYATYDKNIDPNHPAMKTLIERVGATAPLGIHPSYQSNDDHLRLAMEIKRLRSLSGKAVNKSRQHYLKLHLPITYRRLVQQQIEADYSMGYADDVGFRASTAVPFYWYDLEKEEVTRLKIVPFQVMDVTLKTYLQLSPEQARNTLQQLVKTVRQFGGNFIPLWHNSSFSSIGDWEAWKDVYFYLLEIAQDEND